MNLQNLVRSNIWNLKAYSSARNEFKGEASVFIDANENPLSSAFNRYPDPLQWKLKEKVSKIKNIPACNIFFGNGSDEPIDLVIRIFCEPGIDNIVAIDPTYGMYQVCADVNGIDYRKVLLEDNFQLNADALLSVVDDKTKIIFLCSPNNPTGNLLNKKEVEKVITSFKGIVVLDEAYIDFSAKDSWLSQLDKYPNLIVLQTFSKAWGLAAIRLGMAFASEQIISFFNKVKYPYNINQLTQDFVIGELDKLELMNEWVEILLEQRLYLFENLGKLKFVEKIFPSDANFVLIKVSDADQIYNYLTTKGVIVRNRNTISLCQGCLRITVGTKEENKILIETLQNIE